MHIFYCKGINPVLVLVTPPSISADRTLSVWMSTSWKDGTAGVCEMTLLWLVLCYHSACGFSLPSVHHLIVLPKWWLKLWIESEASGSAVNNLINVCSRGRTCSYVSLFLQTTHAELASAAWELTEWLPKGIMHTTSVQLHRGWVNAPSHPYSSS